MRLGQLALDTSRASWAASHAALPVPERVNDREWDVYLSLRDSSGRARIGRTRLTFEPAPRFGPVEPDPIIDLGERGTFDDSGVVCSCLVADGDRRLFFYTGWSRGVTVPFYLGAGLAISERGGPFRRASRAPLLERADPEPFLTASPAVLREGDRWRMWYVSGTGWVEGQPEPCYNIRYTESADGIAWQRPGDLALDYASADEHAFGRPWVVKDGAVYRMWFSHRGDKYRIGYAESSDGRRWTRADAAGGLAPGEGWESDMVEYPCIIDHQGRRYMLYNGNDYGKTGVGLAMWAPGGEPR